MKTFTVLLIWLFASPVWAAPFLICDPQTGITQYQVEINGVVQPGTFPAEVDGSIRYDLAGKAKGSYVFRLKCSDGSVWWSEWSDPLNAVKPEKPLNVGVGE